MRGLAVVILCVVGGFCVALGAGYLLGPRLKEFLVGVGFIAVGLALFGITIRLSRGARGHSD